MRIWAALTALFLLMAMDAQAQDRLRIAVFDAELRRDGPGLLLWDIGRDDDQVDAAIELIANVRPDILALLSFDWDYEGQALRAFADRLGDVGALYPHLFSARPNSGLATDLDLDGDGRRGGPGDAQGYGDFTGHSGLAVLSVHPIRRDDVRDFSEVLWRDMPGALLPKYPDGRPFPSAQALEVQRLSSTNHWAVPVTLPNGTEVTVLTFHASPPVFDGPEDRNGRRNHDEVLFWRHYLDGAFGEPPQGHFVLAGGANLDPVDSDGRREAIRTLLDDPRLQDPLPGQDTVDWTDVGAGRLRVDYVLPSADWQVLGAGIETIPAASRHSLVWVDLALP